MMPLQGDWDDMAIPVIFSLLVAVGTLWLALSSGDAPAAGLRSGPARCVANGEHGARDGGTPYLM